MFNIVKLDVQSGGEMINYAFGQDLTTGPLLRREGKMGLILHVE
jgi:hypothetical protein